MLHCRQPSTVACLPLLAVLPLVQVAAAPVAFPGLPVAAGLPGNAHWFEDEAWGDYNLRLRYEVAAPGTPQVLLILNRVDDANHYRLSVSADRSRLERVEAGLRLGLREGTGLGASNAGRLLVKRRGARIELFLNGRSVLAAHDATFAEGTIGYASPGGLVNLSQVELQPVQSLAFTDDFMRAEGQAGDWETVQGLWKTRSLLNPFRSVNAFTYAGIAHNRPAIAVVGHSFWDDYRVEAAMKSAGTKPAGLIVAWQDAENYLLFEWTSRTKSSQGVRRLVAVEGGQRRLLTESAGGFRVDQWYRVALTFRRGHLLAAIDDMPVCAASILSLPGGKVGLYTKNFRGTYFDDVTIESAPAVTSSFDATGELGDLSGRAWRVQGGHWRCLRNAEGDGLCEARPASVARALIGGRDWADYSVRALVTPGKNSRAGLLLHYQDEGNHLSLQLQRADKMTVALVRNFGGKQTTLATAEVDGTTTEPLPLGVEFDRGVLSARVRGEELFEVFDDSFTCGQAGLMASGESVSLFDDFAVEFPSRSPEPVFTIHEIFEGEVSMANWSAAQSDWTPTKTKIGAQEVDLQWHRASFWGATEVQADSDLTKGTVGLLVCAANAAPGSGYQLTADGANLVLAREGREVARSKLGAEPDVYSLRLRRGRNVLVVMVDGDPRLTYVDPEPLTGTHVGWYATGQATNVESVEVFNPHVRTDTFRSAPVDWREAGGWWAVSRRWQCDPRWSFFSGLNEGGSAVLWYKRPLRGDQDVEFAAGVKMARQHGDYAAYGRDLNMVLCADGKDATTGYSFVFGGWGNTKTAIVRGTAVVAEAPPPVFSYKIHHQWFLLRAEKRGPHLAFYVDGAKVCEYEDPEPLTGDRMGLWTYQCGMMVSRFRACAQNIGPPEPVGEAWPAQSKTFYEVAK